MYGRQNYHRNETGDTPINPNNAGRKEITILWRFLTLVIVCVLVIDVCRETELVFRVGPVPVIVRSTQDL